MTVKKDDFNGRDLIEFKFSEVFKRLDRMESTMNSFAFAKQSDLTKVEELVNDIAKDIRDNYVKKESLKWMQNVLGGIAVGIGVAIVIAVFRLIGAKL